MLFQLKTGWVPGYNEGQEPLIYLVSAAQAVAETNAGFVFSDGHGLAAFTQWFDNLDELDKVDWGMVYQRYWRDEPSDMDRQRRKQAEFLVHRTCDWGLVQEIGVINQRTEERVGEILARFSQGLAKPLRIAPNWYY